MTIEGRGRIPDQRRQAVRIVQLILENDYSLLLFSLGLLIVGFAVLAPQFLTFRNFINILQQSSVIGITAIGMTFVIVGAGIDISVGSVAAFIGAVVAKLLVADVPTGLAVPLALGLGALIGLANGLAITRLGLNAFIVTLASLAIFRGGAFAITQAVPVSYFPDTFQFLGIGRIGPMPVAVGVLFLTSLVGYFLLKFTAFGRALYAIGGNAEAARLSGIRVGRVVTLTYVIAAASAALAGITLTARLNTAWATAAQGLEFQAITAVIIGGGSLFGARGSIVGTLLGAIVLGMLNNGLSILNVSAFQIQFVNGFLIFMVVLIDRIRLRVRSE